MRGAIKGVLAEELGNSLRMKIKYEEALERLPQGCLVAKKIKRYQYYYLVKREGKKVGYVYKGKNISSREKAQYKEAKLLRAKYRNLLSQVKKQIKYLRSSLRGKQAI